MSRRTLIDSSENVFVGWALNFRVRMLVNGAVKATLSEQ